MQQNLDKIQFIHPLGTCDFEKMRNLPPKKPFDDEDVDFLGAVSVELMKNMAVRRLPDVATFAFFCRKANLLKLKERFVSSRDFRLGRGLVFHIAPSNVPVNFAYSLVCGILSGNSNIVRVPSKEFEQVNVIADAIGKVSLKEKYLGMENRLALVKYDRGANATKIISELCDVRVIWGGDATISDIRKNDIPARAFDVTFADRYSIAVIDAERYLKDANESKEAENFYNDTYLFDQNACSAPHLVIWRGNAHIVKEAQDKFWRALYEYTSKKYELADVLAVDKLVAFYSQSLAMNIRRIPTEDNLIWRIEVDSLPENIDSYRCKAGFFAEHRVDTLEQMSHIINRKYQTIAYYGLSDDEIKEFLLKKCPFGVDRVVPLGKTTEFSLEWDGYNMIDTLSRVVTIK